MQTQRHTETQAEIQTEIQTERQTERQAKDWEMTMRGQGRTGGNMGEDRENTRGGRDRAGQGQGEGRETATSDVFYWVPVITRRGRNAAVCFIKMASAWRKHRIGAPRRLNSHAR